MKCHYEILEVARDADDSEIKTAYRKLALKWHPDKNLDNIDNAKEQFQLVQQAYEVLSDRQERAWYDKHRDQILHSGDSDFKDDSLDVFMYFTSQCFKGYGDDEQGFYSVYRNVFEEIAKEDIAYMDSKSDYDEIPPFGTSTSNYEDVVAPFYAYWMSYSTRKTFVWLDPYNINEIRERRYIKLVEKENKKVRQKAKKERNEEIRNLVAFVRKRDKRVQAYAKQLEVKNAENRQKQEELRKQKILERKNKVHNETQAEWSKYDNVESDLKDIEKHVLAEFDDTDSEEELTEEQLNDLYCIACNKIFKTPKALKNHESSKKHKENTEKIKQLMQEEEEDFQEDEISDEMSSEMENLVNEGDENSVDDISAEFEKIDIENDEIIESTTEEINIRLSYSSDSEKLVNLPGKKSKKKAKKNKKVIKMDKDNHEHEEKLETTINIDLKVSDNEDFDFNSSGKKPKKKQKNKTVQDNTNKVNNEIKINSTKDNKAKNKTTSVDLEEIDTSHVCVTCKSNFNSKNKLFDHLKKTGHSVLIPQQKNPKQKKKAAK